jgi:hypothetical protein
MWPTSERGELQHHCTREKTKVGKNKPPNIAVAGTHKKKRLLTGSLKIIRKLVPRENKNVAPAT